jgi:SAM-dependent methyltransferase
VPQPFPPLIFDREDESSDAFFYQQPRMVVHIDKATIAALSQYYGEILFEGARVLDLMSSWVSHLPEVPRLDHVSGLGMNAQELGANPALSDWVVHDLNLDPALPHEDASFDFVLNAVSIQYLTRPFEVFAEIARVLRPGGVSVVAMSHRCFPTKAIRFFHSASAGERCELVRRYHIEGGDFSETQVIDRSPRGADPLWLVMGRR